MSNILVGISSKSRDRIIFLRHSRRRCDAQCAKMCGEPSATHCTTAEDGALLMQTWDQSRMSVFRVCAESLLPYFIGKWRPVILPGKSGLTFYQVLPNVQSLSTHDTFHLLPGHRKLQPLGTLVYHCSKTRHRPDCDRHTLPQLGRSRSCLKMESSPLQSKVSSALAAILAVRM